MPPEAGPDRDGVPSLIGLCGDCIHARPIVSDRGSRFLLCDRSRTDPRYPRYPRLPVVRCAGYEAIERSTLSGNPDD